MNKLSGNEQIHGLNAPILDFWSWAYSDILSNRNRSIYAEFLVASALGLTDKPRIEWDAVDLVYKNTKIEIKSASYVQSCEQKKLSSIRFDIAHKKGWDSTTNTISNEVKRSANVYVFCLFADKDMSTASESLFDAKYWNFYLVKTSDLPKKQKSISLAYLESISSCTSYGDIQKVIDGLMTHL